MKKLSLSLLAMGTALAIAPAALADSIQIGSYANGVQPAGSGVAAGDPGTNANTALLYNGILGPQGSTPITGTPVAPSLVAPNAVGATAYNVSPLSGGSSGTQVWINPVAGSSYVSNTALAGPWGVTTALSNEDQNGYYYYTSTFTASPTAGGGNYGGTITVLADDTMALYIDNQLIVNFGNVGNDGHCAANVPNCASLDTVSISGLNLVSGLNTIEVIDAQTDVNAAGIDFEGTISQTPEPSSLLLLGTGLLGLAFVAFRKAKSSGAVVSM